MRPPWKQSKLDKLGFVGRGRSRHRPRNDPALFGGAYPFFQTGEVKAAELYLHEHSQTYNEEGLAQSKQWAPGTLCITIAANIAESAILTIPGCFPDSVVGFVADETQADTRFVKYSLDILKLRMQNISRGTTQDNLSLDKLLTIDFPTPPLPIQRKIAAILCAYDDLVENNTRRIAILEEMARLLYREWFVDFRFPGHECVPIVDSPLGPVPAGWTIRDFGNVAMNFDSKRIPLSSMARAAIQGPYPYYGAANVLDHVNDYIFDGQYLLTAEDGSVITAGGKPVLQRVSGRFWANNHAHVIQGKSPVSTNFLYLMMSGYDISGHITGAAQPKITQHNLNRIRVLVPAPELLAEFDDFVGPSFELLDSLLNANLNLRQTRDFLLPRLISGEIDVEDLDINTAGLAA